MLSYTATGLSLCYEGYGTWHGEIIPLSHLVTGAFKRGLFPCWSQSVRCSVRRIHLSITDFEDGERGVWTKESSWHLGVENSPQLTVSKETDASLTAKKDDSFPDLPERSTALPTPGCQLFETWAPWTFDLQKLWSHRLVLFLVFVMAAIEN